jgi:hypothetical protein
MLPVVSTRNQNQKAKFRTIRDTVTAESQAVLTLN